MYVVGCIVTGRVCWQNVRYGKDKMYVVGCIVTGRVCWQNVRYGIAQSV
jgi:hypothetical protein